MLQQPSPAFEPRNLRKRKSVSYAEAELDIKDEDDYDQDYSTVVSHSEIRIEVIGPYYVL